MDSSDKSCTMAICRPRLSTARVSPPDLITRDSCSASSLSSVYKYRSGAVDYIWQLFEISEKNELIVNNACGWAWEALLQNVWMPQMHISEWSINNVANNEGWRHYHALALGGQKISRAWLGLTPLSRTSHRNAEVDTFCKVMTPTF